jgi:hypothetical protein
MARSPDQLPNRIIQHRDSRRVFDPRGRLWEVFEDSRESYAERSLIFQTHGLMRRIRDFPADWREMPDAELAALSDGA